MNSGVYFISPYPELTGRFNQALEKESDPPNIIEGAMEGAEPLVSEAERQGAEVFVTTEGHARYLRPKTSAPIVGIPRGTFEATHALHRAKVQYGDPIALFEFRYHDPRLPALKEIIGYRIRYYIYQDIDDGLAKLRQAKKEGCKAVVSGGLLAGSAQRVGCQCVPMYPSTDAILQAYHQALQIAWVRKTERHEAMKFKSIVRYSFEGIIVVDQNNEVAVFNPAAEHILRVPVDQILGQSVDKILPQGLRNIVNKTDQQELDEVITFEKRKITVNKVPIVDKEKIVGTIFTLQEVSKIQSLEEKIRRVVHSRGLTAKMTFQDIVGISTSIKDTINRAQRFSSTDETILITGETGTGKEIFAQSIHNASPRCHRPFVAINCAAIPSSLLESELFGYAEGAFTGARWGGRQGVFELAHKGTIFLDEIGELPMEVQLRLLRVLQEKEIMRVGDNKIIPLDVRVIAVTNQPLEQALQEGRFRLDLYHRLNVLRLTLAPLRKRPDDIIPLTKTFLKQWCSNQQLARKIEAAFRAQDALIVGHAWPGNVRELQNLIKRTLALADPQGETSLEEQIKSLLIEVLNGNISHPEARVPIMLHGDLKGTLEHIERQIIHEQHQLLDGDKTALARALGIGRTTLWRKLIEAGIQ